MDSDNEILQQVLKYLTGEIERLCRLCFVSTKEIGLFLDECVSLNNNNSEETISFKDMLLRLTGSIEEGLPYMLCQICADNVKKSYSFLIACERSKERWNKCLKRIKETIDLTNDLNPNIETVYIMMRDNSLFTSKRTQQKCRKSILNKVNSLVRSKNMYQNNKKQSQVVCEECGITLPTKCHLVKHMRTHSSEKYPCPQCHKVFSSESQVVGHAERVHKPKKIMCSKCSKMFPTQKMLRSHDKVHHIAAICKVCFVQLPSRNILRQHMDKHDVNKCPRCDKTYLNKQTFRLHLKICDDKEKAPQFFCDICKRGYVRKNGLRTHLKTDHGFGEVLSCNWCAKKFDAKSKLKNHIVKHTKEKNFHCEQCGGKFVTQASLRYHVRLHTGEKPFPCDLCDESFLSASRRVEHKKRKHIGPTKECTICHNKYVTSHQLRQHMARHENPLSRLYVNQERLKSGNTVLVDKTFADQSGKLKITFELDTGYFKKH